MRRGIEERSLLSLPQPRLQQLIFTRRVPRYYLSSYASCVSGYVLVIHSIISIDHHQHRCRRVTSVAIASVIVTAAANNNIIIIIIVVIVVVAVIVVVVVIIIIIIIITVTIFINITTVHTTSSQFHRHRRRDSLARTLVSLHRLIRKG